MEIKQLPIQRLSQQRISQNRIATPAEVVNWLGAIQAQDYPGAKWALGLRMLSNGNSGAVDEAIEQAFTEGAILRTHVMRPTWHFVTPADIRWMQALTAPRVKAATAYARRQNEIDGALLARSIEVIAETLQGGRQLTRAELGTALAKAGIFVESMRLGHIVSYAELEAVVCSGPRRGKQFTYALLEERAPQARIFEREEALAELARRYVTGHGPATVRDFAWWSGLTVSDAKAGLQMAAPNLNQEALDGQTYWFPASMPPAAPSQEAFLLPTYDEFLVGFAAFDRSRKGGREPVESVPFNSAVVIGGQVAGSWRRTFQKGVVVIEVAPFTPLAHSEKEAVAEAAERYGEFIGMPVNIQFTEM